jgi:tRNA 5-methylaminomethyl-2-thiouridine biosynthesis bifunctional protein
MKAKPVVPAPSQRDANGVPYSAAYDDIYHPRAGALVQAQHVFIGGTGLPARWRGRERFVVLETGFGLGNNFLATWQAWRDDAQRCERLMFVSIERHPFQQADLREAHQASPLVDLADRLVAAWPPLTHNVHRLTFEGGRVELLLAFGDVQDWLPELRMSVDVFYLDGFAPARNPTMWDRRVCHALARLAAPAATLATWSAASALRADLASAGFEVRLAAGTGGKRDITLATFAPRFDPHPVAAPRRTDRPQRHALIVGAGLAGCAAAWALAKQGWSSCVLERRERIAAEASGNPGGLFHGIVNADDGVHARFNRAASFEARAAVETAIGTHAVAGSAEGLLRLVHDRSPAAMRATLAALGLPSDYVQAVSADNAAALCGVAVPSPAWFFPLAGWVDPGGLARSFIERAGAAATLRYGVEVHALRRAGERWETLDAVGAVIDSAPVIVLANAAAATRLLPTLQLPLDVSRGQLSWMATADAPAAATTRLPIAGAGYLLPPSDGRILFGATSASNDLDPSVRTEDHRLNLAQLERLTGQPCRVDPARLGGRTAWRCVTPDRLPVVGALPALDPDLRSGAYRLDQVRFAAREPGLFVLTALGSRGITWSALCAEVLAAAISGAPMPLEASLLDAIDPARFAVRGRRGLDRASRI